MNREIRGEWVRASTGPQRGRTAGNPSGCLCRETMSGALPQQPEEFLDHVRALPHAHVPSIEEELDEYLMLREVNNFIVTSTWL